MTDKLSRRDWVRLAGAAAATGLTGPTPGASRKPSCIVRPSQTEGPYFLDEQLNRSDIRPDLSDGSISEGVPLEITFQVSHIDGDTCVPLRGVIVDIWHCNARGEYSGFEDFGGRFDTRAHNFLRGYQATDENGQWKSLF